MAPKAHTLPAAHPTAEAGGEAGPSGWAGRCTRTATCPKPAGHRGFCAKQSNAREVEESEEGEGGEEPPSQPRPKRKLARKPAVADDFDEPEAEEQLEEAEPQQQRPKRNKPGPTATATGSGAAAAADDEAAAGEATCPL